jgi:hypothetical protein
MGCGGQWCKGALLGQTGAKGDQSSQSSAYLYVMFDAS